jgi:hypothetical protein
MTRFADENSRRTRVQPVFTWLRDKGGLDWPAHLIHLASGLQATIEPGLLVAIEFDDEVRVAPSARRLEWMIHNAGLLAPRDGRQWREYTRRVTENPSLAAALEALARGTGTINPLLKLEGPTSADCLIECEHAVIWVEGKRNDWLEPSTKWDVTRDQLARDAEAAWIRATALEKDFCVLVCHEHSLKHHENLLVNGYRTGTWIGGWPHLTESERELLGSRIGTVTWSAISDRWPPIGDVLRLS